MRIAIDGPVSSGKSTVGSLVAARLGYLFIDTGLMYRALAYDIGRKNLDAEKWRESAEHARFQWNGNPARPELYLDGENLTGRLSSPEVASFTSKVAACPEVRAVLVSIQRDMAKNGRVVMVGRDIGTVVLPDAELKVFLTASVEIRVTRRYEELSSMGIRMDLETLKKEIEERDERDSTRKDSPLRPAPGGIELDTTTFSIEEVVDKIVALAGEK